MEQTISPARKIVGETLVPGELRPTEQALILAILAAGEGHIRNAPPAIDRLVGILQKLGAQISRKKGELVVAGSGLRGFKPVDAPLELDGMAETSLLLVAMLTGQEFTTRVKPGDEQERCRQLLQLLASMGAESGQETESIFVVRGVGKLRGIAHEAVDIDPALKLAVLIAGLYAEGTTSLRESAGNRNRMERFLRERQVTVERRKQEEKNQYLVSIEGGQSVQPCNLEIPGDLRLAYPLMVPALVRRGSELKIRRVAIRSGQRGFLDLVRQIGGKVEIEELGNGTADLTISHSELKATRVAAQRTEKVMEQIPLLAVLATQTQGEFVIRDTERLRQGPFDLVSHLFSLLRQTEARVGEYPEGIVIKGGFPLQGARIDSKGDPGLVMAFAVAGLLAESEMAIEASECLDGIYPEFFPTLHALKEKRR